MPEVHQYDSIKCYGSAVITTDQIQAQLNTLAPDASAVDAEDVLPPQHLTRAWL